MKIETLIRPDLLDLKPYSSARDEYTGKEGVFLDANENPFENGVNRYPDPLQKELKEKISVLKKVNSSQIFLGNGSDECIDLLIRLFCIPGKDKIASISPSYGMYKVSAKINQVELTEILLNEDFSLNMDRLIDGAKNSKIIFICSPNNPTGNAFSKSDICTVLENTDTLVVIDEAYIDFSSEESMISELSNFPNLVVLQTFSKAYGLAGLRLGMMFGSEEVISWINKIKPPYNINQLTQNTALAKLTEVEKVNDQIKIILAERQRISGELQNIPSIDYVYPSDSNFILIKVKDSNKLYNYLVLNKIIARNRHGQPLCDNCIRITIGTVEENDVMLDKIKEFND